MDRVIPLARCDRAARRRERPSPRRDCRPASILANRTSYTDLDVPPPHRINRDTRS